jgi:hypothetical protein
MVNMDIYSNTGHGVIVSAFGGYLFISNSTIGANTLTGLVIIGDGTQRGYIGISNVQFTNDGQYSTNSSPEINVVTFPNLELTNVWMLGTYGISKATYAIDNDTNSPVRVNNLNLAGGTSIVYATAPFSNPSLVTGSMTINNQTNNKLAQYTVGILPTCSSVLSGATAYVTDATAPSYNTTLAGGGAVKTMALCNGANWVAH